MLFKSCQPILMQGNTGIVSINHPLLLESILNNIDVLQRAPYSTDLGDQEFSWPLYKKG